VRYYRPRTTAEAVAALAGEPASARVIIGGTDLLVALRHRTVEPTLLVDLKSAVDLRAPIAVDDEGITFGPTATMTAVAEHPTVRAWFPGLVEAALLVGSVAIRNRASLIANSANGSPAADTSPPLVALDAQVTIASTAGERTVQLRDFFLASRRTRCAPGELVTSMRVPRPRRGSSSAFERMTRRRGVDLATCSIGVAVDPDGSMTAGLGAVGPTTLLGGPTGPVDVSSAEAVTAAIDQLVAPATPIGDVRAGQAYRAAMLRVLAQRAIRRAVDARDLDGHDASVAPTLNGRSEQ
jgi:carbon-monoxide dehydrogenase medium subunit